MLFRNNKYILIWGHTKRKGEYPTKYQQFLQGISYTETHRALRVLLWQDCV